MKNDDLCQQNLELCFDEFYNILNEIDFYIAEILDDLFEENNESLKTAFQLGKIYQLIQLKKNEYEAQLKIEVED